MPATIRYNTLRLALLLIVGAICFVFGARGPLLVLLAFVISMPLSYVLLARWRRGMIEEFAQGRADKVNPARAVRAVNARIESAKDAEDAAIDAAEADDVPPGPPADRATVDDPDGGGRKV